MFLNIARTSIPNKLVVIHPGDKAFFNSNLRRLKRKRDRAFKQAKRNNTPYYWTKYKEIRNSYNLEIKEAKELYDKNLSNLLNTESHSNKRWWQIANSYLGRNKVSSYQPLHDNNQIVVDNKSKAELFNNFFLSHSRVDDNNVILPTPTNIPDTQLSIIEPTIEDIVDQLKSIDVSKATGPDMISPRMLKEVGNTIAPCLHKLFQMSSSMEKC